MAPLVLKIHGRLCSDYMATKRIPVLLYWGGCIIETLEGVTYDRPSKSSISMGNDATYEQLLEKLYKIPMIARQGTILRLTCRYPIRELPDLIVYGAMEIETDENVEAMLNSGQADLVNYVDLYLEFHSTSSEQVEDDSQVVGIGASSSEPSIQRTSQFLSHGSGDEQGKACWTHIARKD